jgi:hypothetical protein
MPEMIANFLLACVRIGAVLRSVLRDAKAHMTACVLLFPIAGKDC